MLLLAFFSHDRNASSLAIWINLHPNRLNITTESVFQSDCKGIHTHHHRSPTGEQKPCSFFRTRHQWILAFIQYENRHFLPFNQCPYGPCDGGRSLSPLGNVHHRLPLARRLKPSAFYLSPARSEEHTSE